MKVEHRVVVTVKGVDKSSLVQLFVGQRCPKGQVVLSGVVHVTAGTLLIVRRVVNQGDKGASKRCLPNFDGLERQASFSIPSSSCVFMQIFNSYRPSLLWHLDADYVGGSSHVDSSDDRVGTAGSHHVPDNRIEVDIEDATAPGFSKLYIWKVSLTVDVKGQRCVQTSPVPNFEL